MKNLDIFKNAIRLIALILICYCPLLMAELPVTDGLVIHLEADSIAGVAEGSPVATWSDLSGIAKDGTQATTANQPVYVASDADYNVHASIQFDGADNRIDLLWRLER